MRTYTLAHLAEFFGYKPRTASLGGTSTARLRIAAPDETGPNLTMLGHELIEEPRLRLAQDCAAFRDLLQLQESTGVDYNLYWLVVVFFTQLGRPDLAHHFAALHPAYRDEYDTSPRGRAATQAAIERAKADTEQKGLGYITYGAFGFSPCTCGNLTTSESSPSPARHVIKRSVLRFFRGKPPRLVSHLVIRELNERFDYVFEDEEKSFYQFDWREVRQKKRRVRSGVD